jgi:hypothetical protein
LALVEKRERQLGHQAREAAIGHRVNSVGSAMEVSGDTPLVSGGLILTIAQDYNGRAAIVLSANVGADVDLEDIMKAVNPFVSAFRTSGNAPARTPPE